MKGWVRAILNSLVRGRRVSVDLRLAERQLELQLVSGISVRVLVSEIAVDGDRLQLRIKPWWLRLLVQKGMKGAAERDVDGLLRIQLPEELSRTISLHSLDISSDTVHLDLELKGLPAAETDGAG